MTEEIIEVIRGRLTGKGVTIGDAESQSQLESRGFGDRDGKKYMLRNYETLYLLYAGKLEVLSKGTKLTLDNFVEHALKQDPTAWTRFLIYRDLRSRGYVAKEGFGFGVDFRVYERGEYNVKPAKYVMFGLNEGTEMTVENLRESVDQITRMGKEPIIAVVERRGEVIYYKVSKARFGR